MIISKLLNLLYNIDNSPALFIILLIFAIIIIIITSSIHIVPKNEVFLILRAKKDFLVLKEGLHFLIPFFSKIVKKFSLNEQQLHLSLTDVKIKDANLNLFIFNAYYIEDFILFYQSHDFKEKLLLFLNEIINNFSSSLTHEELYRTHQNLNDFLYLQTSAFFKRNGLKLNQIYIYFE